MENQSRSTGATIWLVIMLLILAANLGRVHRWYSAQQNPVGQQLRATSAANLTVEARRESVRATRESVRELGE